MIAENLSVLIIWLFLIQVASMYLYGPGQVTGSLGGSVTVSCYYSSISANIHGRKFWCKMRRGQCYTIVSTTPYIEQNYMNRTYLQDFRDHFMINMTSLQTKDAGVYRCGIGNSNNGLTYAVNMTVTQGKKIPSSSEIFIGKLRGSLIIHCPASNKLHNGSLYWCKMSNTKSAACDIIINSLGQVNSRFWGRVLIQEDRNVSGFNILVNDLKMTDPGFYHCGEYLLDEESDWKDVHIHIIEESTRKRTLKPLTAGESLRAKCQVPKDFGPGAVTYWCKWSPAGCPPLVDSTGFIHEGFRTRINLISDNSTDRAYTVTMNHLEVEDSGSYWCVTADGPKVESSSINVNVLGTTTKVYLTSTSSTDATGIRTHSADLLPITEISTIGDPSTGGVGAFTISPVYCPSSSPPPSSGVTLQDPTAALYPKSSSRGQPSTDISTAPSNPDTSPSGSSGTQTPYKSKTTTLASEATQRAGNSAVTVTNGSNAKSQVSRSMNIPLIALVLVIACLIIIATLFAVLLKVQKNRAANDLTTHREQIAMIDGEARLENTEHNDRNVFSLEDSEDLFGETDV